MKGVFITLTTGTALSQRVDANWRIYTMIVVYFLILIIIGFYDYKQATGNLSGYMLGGRSIGPYITALSAGASDMNGWVVMGLPDSVYSTGLSATRITASLTLSVYMNYFAVAPRSRVYAELARDAITLPDFFKNRLNDKNNVLKAISGLTIVVFFTLCTHSGFVSDGKLFESTFGLDYHLGLILVVFIVIFYTFFGGYSVVSITDFFQGVIMLVTMVMVPIVVTMNLNDWETLHDVAVMKPISLNLSKGLPLIGIISLFSWGLGYFGRPHIITRFMSIKSRKTLPRARRLGISWVAVGLLSAVVVGLIDIAFVLAYHIKLEDPEISFVVMSQVLFHPLVDGFLLAATLVAIMNTISSQLLVISSPLTGDLYKLVHGEEKIETHQKEFVMAGGLSVLVIVAVAIAIARNPNDTILNLVGNAWAELGASFSPLVLFAFYWKSLTCAGVVSEMVLGALIVIVWITRIGSLAHINGIFDLYEVIPEFTVSIIVARVISELTRKPGALVEINLNEVRDVVREK